MRTPVIVAAAVAGVAAVVGAAAIVARPYVSLNHVQPMSVKGFATLKLSSDTAVATATVTHAAPTLGEAFAESNQDLDKLILLVNKHFGSDARIAELNAGIREIPRLTESGVRTNDISHYVVSRPLRIETTKVDAMAAFTRDVYGLAEQNILSSIEGPEFFVSDLEQAKIQLAELATKNGVERAKAIADNAGAHLGKLVAARQGVIQITKPNSSDTSDWGVYDTQTIDKEAKLAVTLEFQLR